MVFQAIFSVLFFFVTTVSPEEYRGADVEMSVVSNVVCNPNQVGVVEFLPRASGFELKIKAEGKHFAELRKASEQKGRYSWVPEPFQQYQMMDLQAGVYYLLVSVDEGKPEVFQFVIRE